MIKNNLLYEDDEISIVDRLIPKHVKRESLEALGANFNFIEIWLKTLDDNYDARRVAYSTAMKVIEYRIVMRNKISE